MMRQNSLADYLRLALEGHPPPAIADALGVQVTTVYDQIKKLRRAGHDIPHFQRGRKWRRSGSRLQVEPATKSALTQQADLRGQNVNDLADAVLSRLAQSPRLIAAVLGEPVNPKGD